MFCDNLQDLMKANQVEFFSPIEAPPTPAAESAASQDDDTENASDSQSSFHDEDEQDPSSFSTLVGKFRDMHPGPRFPTDQPLDAKNKEWRRKCMNLVSMGIGEKTKFGGSYKQHLAVATLSQRCFEACQSIMTAYRKGHLLNQRSRKVNRMLFGEIGGCKQEDALFQELAAFRDGRIAKEDFNKKLKELKEQQNDLGQAQGTLNFENERLKIELATKDRIILKQQQQIQTLQQELKKLQSEQALQARVTVPDPAEVYDFTVDEVPETSDDDGTTVPNNIGMDTDVNIEEILRDDVMTATRETAQDEENMTDKRASRKRHPRSFPEKPATDKGQQSFVGKVVEAKDDGEWYQAKVLEETATSMKVHWMNFSSNFDSFVSRNDIREIQLEFVAGDHIQARYRSTNPTMYDGTVLWTEGNYVYVKYFDETEKKIHQRHVKRLQMK